MVKSFLNAEIDGVKLYMPATENECWELINSICTCKTCLNLSCKTLFGGYCKAIEREVSYIDNCECFTGELTTEHWKGRLVSIAQNLNGNYDLFKIQMNKQQNELDKQQTNKQI